MTNPRRFDRVGNNIGCERPPPSQWPCIIRPILKDFCKRYGMISPVTRDGKRHTNSAGLRWSHLYTRQVCARRVTLELISLGCDRWRRLDRCWPASSSISEYPAASALLRIMRQGWQRTITVDMCKEHLLSAAVNASSAEGRLAAEQRQSQRVRRWQGASTLTLGTTNLDSG